MWLGNFIFCLGPRLAALGAVCVALGDVWELWELDLLLWAWFWELCESDGSAESWTCRACQGLGAADAGYGVPAVVSEVQEVLFLTNLSERVVR